MESSGATVRETTVLPAAACSAVAVPLRGSVRSGHVLAVTPHAVLLGLDTVSSTAPRLLCLAGPRAVRLPCALLLGDGRLPPAQQGQPIGVGRGTVRLPTATVVVRRWWPAPEPVLTDPALAAARSISLPPPALPDGMEELARGLTVALRHDRSMSTSAVRALLGRGPGLTPSGDDVLAGALVALRAARHPVADRLAASVAEAEPHRRTTAVSAALLDHAARGQCIPEVAVLLAAFEGPDEDLLNACHDLMSVGHSSGAALLYGVRAGLELTVGDQVYGGQTS